MYSQKENYLPKALPEVSRRSILKGMASLAASPLPSLDVTTQSSSLIETVVTPYSASQIEGALRRFHFHVLNGLRVWSQQNVFGGGLGLINKLKPPTPTKSEMEVLAGFCQDAYREAIVNYENKTGYAAEVSQWSEKEFDILVAYSDISLQAKNSFKNHPSLQGLRAKIVENANLYLTLSRIDRSDDFIPKDKNGIARNLDVEEIKFQAQNKLSNEIASLQRPYVTQMAEQGLNWHSFSGRQQFEVMERTHFQIKRLARRLEALNVVKKIFIEESV